MSFAKTFVTLTSLLSLMGPTSAAPTDLNNPVTNGSPIGSYNMHNLYPQEPERCEPGAQAIHLETFGGLSIREQVAVFKGIPAEAKVCQLYWVQAPTPSQVFIAKFDTDADPAISTRQLSGFPADGVALSYSSVQPFDTKSAETSPIINFQRWDVPGKVSNHSAADIDCAETVYVKLAYKNTTVDMHSYMAQDYANGLLIYYQL